MFEENDVSVYPRIKCLFSLLQLFSFHNLHICLSHALECRSRCSRGHFSLNSLQIIPVHLPQPVWSLHDLTPLWHQNAKLCVWLLLTCSSLARPCPLPCFFFSLAAPRREVNSSSRDRCSSICLISINMPRAVQILS